MTKSIIILTIGLLILIGCQNRSNSNENIDRHSESYIKQRIDSIYSRFNNPTYNQNGRRIIDYSYNYDSAYCSSRYNVLLNQALKLLDDDDILLDYDHWTSSQDPEDFTYEIGGIENITDTTANVILKAKNWGENYTVTLCLFFEKGDWFVDDFIKEYGFKSEKSYLCDFIKKHTGKNN